MPTAFLQLRQWWQHPARRWKGERTQDFNPSVTSLHYIAPAPLAYHSYGHHPRAGPPTDAGRRPNTMSKLHKLKVHCLATLWQQAARRWSARGTQGCHGCNGGSTPRGTGTTRGRRGAVQVLPVSTTKHAHLAYHSNGHHPRALERRRTRGGSPILCQSCTN